MLVVNHLIEASDEEKTKVIDWLYGTKYAGWAYEEEIRFNGGRKEQDEETGAYFVPFDERLELKEVIAGARFPMSKKPIENALKGY